MERSSSALTLGCVRWHGLPLGRGRLIAGEDEQAQRVRDVLGDLGALYGVSAATMAYAWILRHPARPIPITGSGRIEALCEAVRALQVPLDSEDWYRVWRSSTRSRFTMRGSCGIGRRVLKLFRKRKFICGGANPGQLQFGRARSGTIPTQPLNWVTVVNHRRRVMSASFRRLASAALGLGLAILLFVNSALAQSVPAPGFVRKVPIERSAGLNDQPVQISDTELRS